MSYLAIDVGGTFTKYAIVTEDCEILFKDKKPTQMISLEEFLNSLTTIYYEQKQTYDIEGIGLSMPGLIDSKNGFMYTGGFVTCINNLNIVEMMESRCHIPITVENDAKCAALAELWNGVLKDCRNAIVLVCGTGVGGAVIRNRDVLRGSHFVAGEFSYTLTDYEGEYERKSCMAENTGINSLMRYVSQETGIPADELDGVKVFSMANQGDEKSIAGLRKFVRHLAVLIHNCRCMFDPECFAIGGGISVQPLFLQMIKEELQNMNEIFPWKVSPPHVVVCKFFNDANLLGAVYVHLQAREKKLSIQKMDELMKLIGNRREAKYLKELLME